MFRARVEDWIAGLHWARKVHLKERYRSVCAEKECLKREGQLQKCRLMPEIIFLTPEK